MTYHMYGLGYTTIVALLVKWLLKGIVVIGMDRQQSVNNNRQSQQSNQSQLADSLSKRQISMISIGGIIGAGLFVGSANGIATVGPAIVLSYVLTGILVFLVMRMLGEMAVVQPDTGSFSTYAANAIGPWAGFSIGWLYWWFWVLVIPIEAIAGADILAQYINVPSWLSAVVIVLLLTGVNLFNVKNYGEFEFWFALTKVLAIILFIVVTAMAVFGWWPWANISGVSNLYKNGGFMPNGVGAILAGVLLTIFSFFGAEVVSIAAAESKHPQEKIRKATNLVIYRIALFYVLSIFLIVSLANWQEPALKSLGGFQYTLTLLNIPGTKMIMDAVVFVAVCSCLSSALYISSRMLYALGLRHDAPNITTKVTDAGVPQMAVIASSIAGFIACFANYAFPGQVFGFLISSSGAIGLLVYLTIAVSQLRMRYSLQRNNIQPAFTIWFFPWLTWLVIAIVVMVLAYMLSSPSFLYESILSMGLTFIVLICSYFVTHNRPIYQPWISQRERLIANIRES